MYLNFHHLVEFDVSHVNVSHSVQIIRGPLKPIGYTNTQQHKSAASMGVHKMKTQMFLTLPLAVNITKCLASKKRSRPRYCCC